MQRTECFIISTSGN